VTVQGEAERAASVKAGELRNLRKDARRFIFLEATHDIIWPVRERLWPILIEGNADLGIRVDGPDRL
jgi:hypothetical protein